MSEQSSEFNNCNTSLISRNYSSSDANFKTEGGDIELTGVEIGNQSVDLGELSGFEIQDQSGLYAVNQSVLGNTNQSGVEADCDVSTLLGVPVDAQANDFQSSYMAAKPLSSKFCDSTVLSSTVFEEKVEIF